MITRNSLNALKTELKQLIDVIDVSLSPILSKEKLFDSQADYYEALKNQNKVPQDFYKFQFFDTDFYIYFDLRTKRYFVRSDTLYLNEDCGEDFMKSKMCFLMKIKDFIFKMQRENLQNGLF